MVDCQHHHQLRLPFHSYDAHCNQHTVHPINSQNLMRYSSPLQRASFDSSYQSQLHNDIDIGGIQNDNNNNNFNHNTNNNVAKVKMNDNDQYTIQAIPPSLGRAASASAFSTPLHSGEGIRWLSTPLATRLHPHTSKVTPLQSFMLHAHAHAHAISSTSSDLNMKESPLVPPLDPHRISIASSTDTGTGRGRGVPSH